MPVAFTESGVAAVVKNVDKFMRDMGRMNKAMDQQRETQRNLSMERKRAAIVSKVLTRQLEEQRKKMEAANAAGRKFALGMLAGAGAIAVGAAASIKLAGRVETLGVVTTRLGKNVGKTEVQMRALEKSIQDQGITMQASRQAIAQMIQAQVDLSKGAELARLAQNAAVIANIDSSEAFTRLITVIQTGNIRMARTMGLQVLFGRAYKKFAKQIGKTTDELTEQERIQVRVQEVMKAGSQITGVYEAAMGTAGKKVLSLNRHVKDSATMFGSAFLPEYAKSVDAVTASLEVWENLNSALQASTAWWAVGIAAVMAMVGALSLLVVKGGAVLASLKSLSVFFLTNPWILAAAAIGLAITALVAHNKKVREAQKSIKDIGKEVRATTGSFKEYIKRTDEYAEAAGLAFKEEHTVFMSKFGKEVTMTSGELERFNEEMFDSIMAAESADRALIGVAEGFKIVTEEERLHNEMLRQSNIHTRALAAATQAQVDALKAANTAYGAVDTSIASTITTMQESIAWMAGGGLAIQDAASRVQQAFLGGLITGEEANAILNEVGLAGLALQRDLGLITGWEAQKTALNEFGSTWGTVQDDLTAGLEAVPGILGTTTRAVEDAAFDIVDVGDRIELGKAGIAVEIPAPVIESASSFQEKWEGAKTAIETASQLIHDLPSEIITHIEVRVRALVTGVQMGFQHGGQFTVGGRPGPDANLVSFRATRGEVVTVTPTGASRTMNDNRSVTTGDVHLGGQMSSEAFDQRMREWLGA